MAFASRLVTTRVSKARSLRTVAGSMASSNVSPLAAATAWCGRQQSRSNSSMAKSDHCGLIDPASARVMSSRSSTTSVMPSAQATSCSESACTCGCVLTVCSVCASSAIALSGWRRSWLAEAKKRMRAATASSAVCRAERLRSFSALSAVTSSALRRRCAWISCSARESSRELSSV
ncbi:hypothetical protein D3C86_1366240 [compost metagenome]